MTITGLKTCIISQLTYTETECSVTDMISWLARGQSVASLHPRILPMMTIINMENIMRPLYLTAITEEQLLKKNNVGNAILKCMHSSNTEMQVSSIIPFVKVLEKIK